MLLFYTSRCSPDEENVHFGWTVSGPKNDIIGVRGGQQDAGVGESQLTAISMRSVILGAKN